MISMQMTKDEAKEEYGASPADEDLPRYPYGLCLYLDDETLAKLGITTPPDVGTKLKLTAMVEVTSNSQRQTQDGKSVSLDLQITDMELKGEAPSAAQLLYGG